MGPNPIFYFYIVWMTSILSISISIKYWSLSSKSISNSSFNSLKDSWAFYFADNNKIELSVFKLLNVNKLTDEIFKRDNIGMTSNIIITASKIKK